MNPRPPLGRAHRCPLTLEAWGNRQGKVLASMSPSCRRRLSTTADSTLPDMAPDMAKEAAEERTGPPQALALRVLKITAWVLPLALLLLLAAVELRGQSDGQGGALSVANYQARAEVVDTPAPDFELPLLAGGGQLRLSSLRDHVVVLNFWASWCSPCRLEAPDLQSAWKDYRSRGVRFVGVDELDDRFAAQGFIREFAITYPSVFDPSGSLADDYAFIGLPATYVIDQEGTIRFRFQGFLSGKILRSSLDQVLAETGG